MQKIFLPELLLLLLSIPCLAQTNDTAFSKNPAGARFHTEDITRFWKVFDSTYPKFSASVFQEKYIDAGSISLQGFIRNRIESGKNLAKIVKKNLKYYETARESTLTIDSRKDRFYECFSNLKKIYPEAVFPDVYFVIGANNTGGAIFSKGLIIGAERYVKATHDFKPALDIDLVDEVIAHELIHFQQHYVRDNLLLAQCIREGSADFICELIAGSHSNVKMYEYGDAHEKELWIEFSKQMSTSNWSPWLYYTKDKSRPKDLGYWMGYKITRAYYNKATDKTKALHDILNIQDFQAFLAASGYEGE